MSVSVQAAEAPKPRAFQHEVMVIDRRIVAAHLREQAKQAIVRRQQVAQRERREEGRGVLEKQLGRRVGVAEAIGGIEHDGRHRQRAKHRRGLGRQCLGPGLAAGECGAAHAAISPSSPVASRTGRSRATPRSTSGS